MHARFCKLSHQIFQGQRNVESYGSDSICVVGKRSLSSSSCGTYTTGPTLQLCVAQESFKFNGTNHYVVYLEGNLTIYV